MKKNRCDSRRFWDRRSRIYDAQVIPEYKGTYKKIVKRSAHFLSQEDRILEIGCGTGNATIPLAGYVKKITAIDTSREMLDKAKEKMEKSGKSNIQFLKKDIMELEEKAGSYDAVAAYNVLLYMKNQDEVLKKIHDLLKPGGIFISATDCLARNFSLDSAEKFWKSKLGLMPYTSFETPIGLMRKIQKHGFLVLEIVNLHQNPPNIFIVAQKIQKK